MTRALKRLLIACSLLLGGTLAYAQPTFTITNVKNACAGLNNGSFDVNILTANGSVTLLIFGPPNFNRITSAGLTESFVGLKPQNYIVIAQDVDGNNIQFQTITNVAPNISLSAAPVVVNNSNCAAPNGSINISPTGGSGTYNYSWTGPGAFSASTQNLSGIAAGNYIVTITDPAANCSFTSAAIPVTDPLPSLFTISSPSASLCLGDILILNISSPQNGVTYRVFVDGVSTATSIVGPIATINYPGLPAGSHLVSVQASFGLCTPIFSTNTLTIQVNSPPTSATLSLAGANPICAGQSTTLKVNIAGGTGPFSFTITGLGAQAGYTAGNPITVSPVANTTYTLSGLVTDANGCTVTGTGTTTVMVNPLPTATISASPAAICAGQGNSTLTFTLTGTGPFNVSYSDGTTTFNLVGIATGHTAIVSPATTKTYTITNITDATTCVGVAGSNATVNVNIPATSATLSLNGANPICAGQSTSLKVDIIGGTGPYNFTVTGLGAQVGYVTGTPISVTPAATTTYTLAGNTVTDSKGCTVVGAGSSTITVNPLPTAIISASPSGFCAGQGNSTLTFTLTGTGPFNVIYSDGVSPFTLSGISSGHTVVVSPATTTTYTISSITDATACSGLSGSNITVTVSIPPSNAALSLNGVNPICLGQSTTLKVNITGGTGPYNLTITGLGPQVGYVSGTAITVNPVITTTYSLVGNTVTDSKGCTVSGTGSVAVTVNPVPTAVVTASPAAICAGQGSATLTFTLTGTGPFNVIYTDGVSPFPLSGIATGATVVVNPVVTTTYTITSITDATMCAGVSGSNAMVTVRTPPASATLSLNGPNPICLGQSTTLKVNIVGGTGPYNFTIPGIAPLIGYVSGSAITISPVSNTTFDLAGVTVTDSKGCTVVGTGSVPITVNSAPTAVITASPAAICAGQGNATLTFTLTGTAPFNVNYSDGVTTFNLVGISTGHTVIVSPAASTTYTITSVTDATSCVGAVGSNVSVTVSTPATSATLSLTGANPVCVGQSTTLKVVIVGGAGPFNFTIPGIAPLVGYVSGSTISVSPASNTTYDLSGVTVTDSKGCTVVGSGSVPVVVTPAPTAVISGGGAVCSGSPLPNVTFTFTGTPLFKFSYSDGVTTFNVVGYPSTTFTISNAPAGNYSITALTDNIGCLGVSLGTPVAVTVNPLPTAVVSGGGPVCSGSPQPNVTFTFTGTAPYNFSYSDGVTTTPVVGNPTNTFTLATAPVGTYSITALSDNNGCTGVSLGTSVVVKVNPLPTASVSGGGTRCFGLPLPSVTFTFTGAVPFDFSYNDGVTTTAVVGHPSTTFTIANAPAGNYSVVSLKDNNGCLATSLGTPVAVVVTPLATADLSGSATICVGSTVNLSVALTGTPPWNIVYTDGSTNFPANGINSSPFTIAVSPLFTTSYSMVSVTDSNCGAGTVSGTATVTVNPIPGNPATFGIDTWLGYVYDDAGDPTPYTAKVNFSNAKYRGFIDETDIGGMSPFSSYNSATDAFDINISNNASGFTVHGPNLCGSYFDTFSVRYRMKKTFAQGVYTFKVGADDGVRLFLDGVSIIPGAFINQAYKVYTSASQCISAGQHDLVIEYFENGGFARLSFDYQLAASPTVTTPVSACVNSATPTLTASSADPSVTGFKWYKDVALTTLLFSGASFTPAAADLDMTVIATTSFYATAVYACGESLASKVDVNVVSSATITPPLAPAKICQTAGIIDLTTIVSAVPAGGAFTFSGTGVTVSPSFDPTLVAGSTTITANYTSGTCTASTTFNITVISTATITVPVAAVGICQSSTPVDMTTLVSATPLGGTFTFTGAGVAGNIFDPSAQIGAIAITVGYNAGGCIDSKTLNFNVTTNATLTVSNKTVCPASGLLDLTTLVSAVPAGGTFTFSGTSVAGNNFDPGTNAGSVVNVNVSYIQGGCTATGTIAVTVLTLGDPSCGSVINCGGLTVTITDKRPSCSNQNDGTISITVSAGTPNYIVTLTDGGGFNQSLPGPGPVFNFTNLSPAAYTYTIQDAAGHICTLPHTLPVQATVQASASNFVDANCFNQPVGGATVTVNSGGAAPYDYSIDGGSTWITFTSPVVINNLMPAAAPYAILVRDGVGDVCPAQVMVTIGNAVTDILAPTTIVPATCANNDGSIQIGTVSGGVAPYSYALDGTAFASLPATNTFTGLSGGAHIFTVIDANGCNKNFPFNVSFPGQVNFTTATTNPDCTGNGANGTLTATVTSVGTFNVGISTDPVTPPATFQNIVSAGAGTATFINLSKGTYYVHAQSVSAQCPTITTVTIGGGPNAVDFTLTAANVICFENKGGVLLNNITGATGVDFSYEIVNLGIIVQSGTVTSLQAISTVTLTGLNKGDFSIRLFQDQSLSSGCVTPITSAFKPFTVIGPATSLDTLYVNRTISLPDIATGTILVGIQESGLEPYQIKLAPISPTEGNVQDWTDAARNPQDLKIEYNYKKLHPGDYTLSIKDGFGCERDYTISVGVDSNIFIPNIFTPNGDSVNDLFYIRNGEGANVTITNRWGKEVFKSGNYKNDWGGGGIDDGVYYYHILADGHTYNGWLEIQRGQ